MNVLEGIDRIIAIIPVHFGKREDFIADLEMFKSDAVVTVEDLKEIVDLYTSNLTRASWKHAIDKLLTEIK